MNRLTFLGIHAIARPEEICDKYVITMCTTVSQAPLGSLAVRMVEGKIDYYYRGESRTDK